MRLRTIRITLLILVIMGAVLNVLLILVMFQREWLYGDETVDLLVSLLKVFAPPLTVMLAAFFSHHGSGAGVEARVATVPAYLAIGLTSAWLLLMSYPVVASFLTESSEFASLQALWGQAASLAAEISILAAITYYFSKDPGASRAPT